MKKKSLKSTFKKRKEKIFNNNANNSNIIININPRV